MPCCRSLWVHLVWTSLCFQDLYVVSFASIGKFSAIISSSRFSVPFSLSSPSGTPMIQIFIHLMLLQRFLRLFSFFFLFDLPFGWYSLSSLPDCWSILCVIWSAVYSFQCIFHFSCYYVLQFFLSLCWSSYWVYPFVCRVWWASS